MKQGIGGIDLVTIAGLALPLLLLLNTNKRSYNQSFKLDKDFKSKSELIDNIKPYFSFNEQSILNKVQDVIEILNKVNKIKDSNYQNDSVALTTEIPRGDKRERILEEISKHLEGKSKKMTDHLIETRQRVKKAQNNILEHKKIIQQQDTNKTDEMMNFMKSLEPILPNKGNKKVKKLEQLIKLLKTPENEL